MGSWDPIAALTVRWTVYLTTTVVLEKRIGFDAISDGRDIAAIRYPTPMIAGNYHVELRATDVCGRTGWDRGRDVQVR